MKRKIKKIIAGILFASMLTGNVSMNVVYGTENYGDRIEENQSANIEDGGKQFTEEDNTQNQNQNKTEAHLDAMMRCFQARGWELGRKWKNRDYLWESELCVY